MFTWICPKCGRDVPPSYSDCPDCTPRAPKPQAQDPQVTAAPPPPTRTGFTSPLGTVQGSTATSFTAPLVTKPLVPKPPAPASAAVPPPPLAPPPSPAAEATPPLPRPVMPLPLDRPQQQGMPGWLVAIGFAVILAGVLFLLYTYVLPKRSGATSTPAAATAAATTAATGTALNKAHPLAKFLEITGVRFTEDTKQRAKVQFIIVNHSGAELPDLKMQIAIKAAGKTVLEFPFMISSIGPYESKDFSAPVQTKLKGYELPDWQFLKADFEITSQP